MVEKFLKYLQTEKRYSHYTLVSYHRDLIQFYDFLSSEPSNIIRDYRKIRTWIAWLFETGYNARTIRRKISALKSFYKFLIKQGLISFSPIDRIVIPKVSKKLPVFIPFNQFKKLNSYSDISDFIEMRDFLVVEILYWTGMRRNELVNLKITDIDFDRSLLRVFGKGKKYRLIPLDINILDQIRYYENLKQEFFKDRDFNKTYLIVSNRGNRPYAKLINRIVNRFLTDITTIEKKSPHVLRHTFATHLLNNGADINDIKELLGHSSLAATEIYIHNSFEKLKKIYKQAHPRA